MSKPAVNPGFVVAGEIAYEYPGRGGLPPALFLLSSAVLFALLCALDHWWAPALFPGRWQGWHVCPWGIYVFLIALCLAGAGFELSWWRSEPGRLILGSDRLQFVTRRGRVLTQIPYRNIGAAKLVDARAAREVVVKRIEIDLRDPDDPDTFVGRGPIYRKDSGCDCYCARAEELHERLQAHLQKLQTS